MQPTAVTMIGMLSESCSPVSFSTERILTGLIGDTNGDLRVRANDVGNAGDLVGTSPIDPLEIFEVRNDIDVDGGIDSDDVDIIGTKVGNDARNITNP